MADAADTDDSPSPFNPGDHIVGRDLNCLLAPCETFVEISFNRVDLYGAHFERARFERCHFTEVAFTKATMNGACFVDCRFDDCTFFRADMVAVELQRCQLRRCDLSGITLCDARLEDVQFVTCPTAGSAICENEELRVDWIE